MTAPRLEIDLIKLEQNARTLVGRLGARGIGVTGITKATLGDPDVARAMLRGGVTGLGDARVENLARVREGGIVAPLTLIRAPMLSQVDTVVAASTSSLNSERHVIDALGRAAGDQGLTHDVMLMVELGDLREGAAEDELDELVRATIRSPHLRLVGLGTNLACQSGVIPDRHNMGELSRIVDAVEARFDLHLDRVSGGNSANLGWALEAEDRGRVNDLRLGESILLGRDPVRRDTIADLHTDAFVLVGEVIESKMKPAQPWGTVGQSAFGTPTVRSGGGTRAQALLAIGRQDIDPDGVVPPPGIHIIGASSDHLVVETGTVPCCIGREVRFGLDYAALLRAMTSPFVAKTIVPSAVSATGYAGQR